MTQRINDSEPPSPASVQVSTHGEQVLGEYEILGKLGQGGMGAVYRARQTTLQREVALKLLPANFEEDDNYVARFRREASVAAGLNHPNLVHVYTSGVVDGSHYIAMELVEGENLRQRLRRGDLSVEEAVRITLEVARGLAFAWQQAQLIHRDIKPSNIYLAKGGGVKVGDLGLAKSLLSNSTAVTHTGTAIGTPHYISPEQARGEKGIDFRADIYSLGCTLYEMLTGSTPYFGSDAMTIMGRHVNAPPPVILKVMPTCPLPLARLVSKMLRKSRHERPQTYQEIIAVLEGIQQQLASGARQPIPKPTVLGRATSSPGQPGADPPRVAPTSVVAAAATAKPRRVNAALAGVLAVLIAAAAYILLSRWSASHSRVAMRTPAGPAPLETTTPTPLAPPELPIPESAPRDIALTVSAPLVSTALPPPNDDQPRLIKELASAPNGNLVFADRDRAAVLKDGEWVKKIDLETGAVKWQLNHPLVEKIVSLAQQDKLIVAGRSGGAFASLVETASGRQLANWMLNVQNATILALGAAPDGKHVAVAVLAGESLVIRALDVEGLQEVGQWELLKQDHLFSLAWLDEHRFVVSTGDPNQFMECDLRRPTAKPEANSAHIGYGVAYDPATHWLAGSRNEAFVLARERPGPDATVLREHFSTRCVQFIPPRFVAAVSMGGDGLFVWDVHTGQLAREIHPEGFLEFFDLSQDGSAGLFSGHKTGGKRFASLWRLRETPAPSVTLSETGEASKDQPFVNSLGMKFVPVPITGGPSKGQLVLFSIWETRVRDFRVFAEEKHLEWRSPGFSQNEEHPCVNVSWETARAFCDWLTERERKAGRLTSTQRYRLPNDHEWSCAVGLGTFEWYEVTTEEKQNQNQDRYPWGTAWPPPSRSANLADESLHRQGPDDYIADYDDGYPCTAPVGSFAPNARGLYDMSGNVSEWCEDARVTHPELRILRGGCWKDSGRANHLFSSYRNALPVAHFSDTVGFRIVLAPAVP